MLTDYPTFWRDSFFVRDGFQGDPPKLWELLHQRYSTDATFSKATIHSALARIRYSGKSMQDCIKTWELMNAHSASMCAPIDK